MSANFPDHDHASLSSEPTNPRRSFLKIALGLGVIALTPSSAFGATKTTKRVRKTTKKVAAAATTTKATTSTQAGATGNAGATANEVVVGFTYVPTGGGRVHNPYIAVWLEKPDGTPVRTLTVQYQEGKGVRWLPDLVSWYQMDQARLGGLLGGSDVLSAVSSATKLPGSQRVIWDGTDDSKVPVPEGEYVLFIEAAREKGPYQIVREPITLSKAGTKKVADNGDLQAISIDIRAKK
jgi:hypothetical protein